MRKQLQIEHKKLPNEESSMKFAMHLVLQLSPLQQQSNLRKRGILLFLDSSSFEEAARLSDVETAYYEEKADIIVPVNDSFETDDLVVDLLCNFVERENKSRVKHVGIK
jgi:predicted HTH domain antitoxin